MIKEKEIWTEITEVEFNEYLLLLTSKLGDPKEKRRLALQATDSLRTDLDTRVRITNGKAVVMQKIGEWSAETRDELEVEIDSSLETVFKVYKVLRNMIASSSVQTSIMQMESFLFENKDMEIKLTKQTGGEVAYNYEIEVFDNGDPLLVAKKYSMRVEIPDHSPNFWESWNKRVNLNSDDLSDAEVREIISKYL